MGLGGKVICIDPGHGGADPGAVGNGVREKDVVFGTRLEGGVIVADGMAQRIGNHLRRLGVRTVMTREQDRRTTFAARALAAKGADLYVSLHCNAHSEPAANGCEVWYAHTGKPASGIAQKLLTAICNVSPGLRSRGIKSTKGNTRAWNVLRQVSFSMPAVLIEFGFVSNAQDARLLADRHWRDRTARSIAEAIKEYFAK